MTRRSVLGWRRTRSGAVHPAARGPCCETGPRSRAPHASRARGKQMIGPSARPPAGLVPLLEMFPALLTIQSPSKVERCRRHNARKSAGQRTSQSASVRLACGPLPTGVSATASAAALPRPAQPPAPGPAPTPPPTSPSPAPRWSAGLSPHGPSAPPPAAPASRPARPPASPRTAPGTRPPWSRPAPGVPGHPGTGECARGSARAGSRSGT
mmetsp:Transcript_46742/g.123542  ORF Transcript_46742/g.123542 Transcript_46742/m.123542 type:complete len:211 (-) Transcript_46742:41-673(-)